MYQQVYAQIWVSEFLGELADVHMHGRQQKATIVVNG